MDYRTLKAAALLAATLAPALPATAQDATPSVEQFRVTRVTNWQQTWLVGFDAEPAACSGSYKGHHAIVQQGGGAPSELVTRLLLARNAGVFVDVAYVGSGPCDEAQGVAGLVRVVGVR